MHKNSPWLNGFQEHYELANGIPLESNEMPFFGDFALNIFNIYDVPNGGWHGWGADKDHQNTLTSPRINLSTSSIVPSRCL